MADSDRWWQRGNVSRVAAPAYADDDDGINRSKSISEFAYMTFSRE